MTGTYTVSEAAEILGVSPHTLRYYDQEGLVSGLIRTDGNARRFDENSLNLVRLLMKLRATGMPIRRIREYVSLIGQGQDTLDQRLEIIRNHHAEVVLKIAELEQNRAILEAKMEIYHSGTGMDCTDHPAVQRLNQLLKETTS